MTLSAFCYCKELCTCSEERNIAQVRCVQLNQFSGIAVYLNLFDLLLWGVFPCILGCLFAPFSHPFLGINHLYPSPPFIINLGFSIKNEGALIGTIYFSGIFLLISTPHTRLHRCYQVSCKVFSSVSNLLLCYQSSTVLEEYFLRGTKF